MASRMKDSTLSYSRSLPSRFPLSIATRRACSCCSSSLTGLVFWVVLYRRSNQGIALVVSIWYFIPPPARALTICSWGIPSSIQIATCPREKPVHVANSRRLSNMGKPLGKSSSHRPTGPGTRDL